jgi:hypothetical protein
MINSQIATHSSITGGYGWYAQIKEKGVTMTALLAKAVALALAKHPVVNASCKDGQSFTYNANINIAVAVALDGGLLTPVLANADKVRRGHFRKSFFAKSPSIF